MASDGHIVTVRYSPVSVLWICSCGWSTQQSRRQNAWARTAKLRAAYTKHRKEWLRRQAEPKEEER